MSGQVLLTPQGLLEGLRVLAERDPDLRQIWEDLGQPPMWAREPGFPALIHIILQQQVSLASAQAAYDRLLAAASPLTPDRFLELGDEQLKAIGFSRQKTEYGRVLAQALVEGHLNLDTLESMDDGAVRMELTQLKGIGPWTADIYLLMALLRPDIWPSGDLALAIAVQRLKGLTTRPTLEELDAIGEKWRPWRAIAARLLWHYYLSSLVGKSSQSM